MDATPVPEPTAAEDGNALRIVRGKASASEGSGEAAVEIVLTSNRSFPVTGAMPKLTVGDKTVSGGDISADGKTMTISVPSSDFNDLPKGAAVSLFVQASSPVWRFSALP